MVKALFHPPVWIVAVRGLLGVVVVGMKGRGVDMVIVAHGEGADGWGGRTMMVGDISDDIVVTLHRTGVHAPRRTPCHAP